MTNGVFIVFDHQHRITEVTQRFERFDQPLVVALVQTDGRFIEHVEHSTQARTDLRSQTNALAFAAGKGGGIAVEREIAEPDRVEKFQPLHDLAAKTVGDQSLRGGRIRSRVPRRSALRSGKRREIGNGQGAHFNRK